MEIQIHCKYDVLLDPKELKPHPRNKNRHPKEQVERIKKVFAYQGIRKACVVSNRSGFMTTWHGRLLAAKEMKIKVPVVYQDYESEDQEAADLNADNSLAMWAEFDMAGLNEDMKNFDGATFDPEWLGFKDFEVEAADKKQKKPCPQCGYLQTKEG